MGTSSPYVFTLRSHPDEILQAAEDVGHFCRQHVHRASGPQLSAPALDRLHLVLVESLNNIAEHAYDNKTNGSIDIQLHIREETSGIRLNIRLKDAGRINEHGAVPKALHINPEEPLELPEGGFGLNIMHQLCENLRYYREKQHNYFEFSMLLQPDSG